MAIRQSVTIRSAQWKLKVNCYFFVKQNPKPHGAKIVMASMVRHAEDKLNIKPTQGQGVKGRLTEGQIIQIFSDLRFSAAHATTVWLSFLCMRNTYETKHALIFPTSERLGTQRKVSKLLQMNST